LVLSLGLLLEKFCNPSKQRIFHGKAYRVLVQPKKWIIKEALAKVSYAVIPTKAGIQNSLKILDSGWRFACPEWQLPPVFDSFAGTSKIRKYSALLLNFINPALWARNQWLSLQRGAASLWSRAGFSPAIECEFTGRPKIFFPQVYVCHDILQNSFFFPSFIQVYDITCYFNMMLPKDKKVESIS
jgi:hypothetical protein